MSEAEVWGNRVRGCLLGGALGDAVGRPLEGVQHVTPRAAAVSIDSPELYWTDDTALLVALADYLARLPGWDAFDEDALADAFARQWRAAPDRGYGMNPPRIFREVLAGRSWRPLAEQAFGGMGSLGNGGAMRAAPMGVLPVQLPVAASLARRSASITHTHPEGMDGAAAMAAAAHLCLRHDPSQPLTAEKFLAAIARQMTSPRMLDAVFAVADTLHIEDPVTVSKRTGNGISAVEAVPAALSAFLHRTDPPVEAIRFAVLMGGDTDTVATMAGCLAGALHGETALPSGPLVRLEAADHIRATADQLASHTLHTPQ